MKIDPEKQQLRQYVRMWADNGPLLEEFRDREIRQADTAVSIRMFESAFRMAVRDLAPRGSSGLVEWQDFMGRWRRHG